MRVLIVDDDPSVRSVLRLALSDRQWDVHAVETAEEGLVLAAGETWDVLVLDKNLPGMDGVEASRRIREQDRTVAIVMITALGTTESALDAMQHGVDDYIRKPFENIFEIVNRIQRCAEKCHARRAVQPKPVEPRGVLSGLFKRTPKPSVPTNPAVAPKALLISISPLDVSWLQQRLARWTDVSEHTRDAADALGRLRFLRPDIVFLDFDNLQDPIPFLSQLRERLPRAICVVVKKAPALPFMTHVISGGARAVLSKPLKDDEFAGRIAPLIEELSQPTVGR